MLSKMRNISIAGLKPFSWLPSVYAPNIPYLATGGVISSPTLAMMGEGNRKEAVLPLDRNTEWMDEIAEKVANSSGGQPISITVQIGEERIGEKIIDYIRDKGMRTGNNILHI